MNVSLFSRTPSVNVFDNRAQIVREIGYHRHPDTPDITCERITRHAFNERGFPAQSADPRLHHAGHVNFRYLTGLNGAPLLTQSADAGTSLSLSDVTGQPLLVISNIDVADESTNCAVTKNFTYEERTLAGRLLSVTERIGDEAACITERFVYGRGGVENKVRNLAGALVCHYDTAGLVKTESITLTGVPSSVTRRFLKDTDASATMADWQGQDASEWNKRLQVETFTTRTTVDAAGEPLLIFDAKDNIQRVTYDVAGRLASSGLKLKNDTEKMVIKSVEYTADGKKQREEHGNGVVTTYSYFADTQRLAGVRTERLAGHPSGQKLLQDLRFEYDPVGNVMHTSNDAEETRFWRNQKIVPKNAYIYDSLYQLVSATGREMADAGQQNSRSPFTAAFTDSSALTHYLRHYSYDEAGNLTQIKHHAPAANNCYTKNFTLSNHSNRGVLSTLTENPEEVDALFTAGGQQSWLMPGQKLVWTHRNELQQVTPVARDGDASDQEVYRYDGNSQRVIKLSRQKKGSTTQTQRVLYLPGLELRTTTIGSTETEMLQIINMGKAGRADARVLHWESGCPAEISNNQIRYGYNDLVGSGTLELDGDGDVISVEEYYPYGGTAVKAGRNRVEMDYKMARYSGKERDATGLYYYGYRYYQPWAGRWLSTDPAGTVDGLNLYKMVMNNPVTFRDNAGMFTELDWQNKMDAAAKTRGYTPARMNFTTQYGMNTYSSFKGASDSLNPYGLNQNCYYCTAAALTNQTVQDLVSQTQNMQQDSASIDEMLTLMMRVGVMPVSREFNSSFTGAAGAWQETYDYMDKALSSMEALGLAYVRPPNTAQNTYSPSAGHVVVVMRDYSGSLGVLDYQSGNMSGINSVTPPENTLHQSYHVIQKYAPQAETDWGKAYDFMIEKSSKWGASKGVIGVEENNSMSTHTYEVDASNDLYLSASNPPSPLFKDRDPRGASVTSPTLRIWPCM